MYEKLEEVFDLVPAAATMHGNREVVDVVDVEPDPEQQDTDDRRLARETYKRMMQKSEEMLDNLMSIAVGTEHPRAFEVAANLVKTITETAGKLDDAASKKLVKGKADEGGVNTNVNHNHLYVGSSEDLFKLIKQNQTG